MRAQPNAIVGVVMIDADGDGVISPADEPATEVVIRAGSGDVRFRPEWSTRTDSSGNYVLELPSASSADTSEEDLFIEVEFGLARGATVSIRHPVLRGERTEVIVPPVPRACRDAACDDELLPDLVPVLESAGAAPTQPLSPDSWSLDADTQPGRRLLRFSSAAVNVGDGPLHVVAGSRAGDGIETFQRTWTAALEYRDTEAGVFVFHDDHDHIHLEGFEQYRLLGMDGTEVAAAEKVSFCLVDTWPITPDEVAELRREPAAMTAADLGIGVWDDLPCGTAQQAINVGWADYYGAELADQWIDVTDVAAGDYVVEITVDPDGILRELDESNNIVTFPVTLLPDEP